MPQLDGVRALAVLAVVLHHTLWRDPTLWQTQVLAHLNLGHAGVRLFFVLSGFLITGILLKARSLPGVSPRQILSAFFVRRALRIFPIYYLSILVLFLAGDRLMRDSIGWHLLYASNFYVAKEGAFPGPPVSHLWSLAVEEQFYVVWGVLAVISPRRWILLLISSALVIGPASRALLLFGTGNPVAATVFPTSCFDSLGMGALLAWAQAEYGTGLRGFERVLVIGLVVGVGLLACTKVLSSVPALAGVLNDTAYSLMFVWLVHHASVGFGGWIGRALQVRPLVFCGVISYGVYLFHHQLPAGPFRRILPLPDYGLARAGVVLLVTLFGAGLCYQFLEAPILRLKRHFDYRKPTEVTSSHTPTRSSSDTSA